MFLTLQDMLCRSVAPQESAPRAATRLGYLFGTAVKLGTQQEAEHRVKLRT